MTDASVDHEAEVAPRCYRHPDRETWISCQRCGRPICTTCQTQAAVGVQCPECLKEGRETTARPSTARRVGNLFRPTGTPIVTYTLIGICVVLYALQIVTGGVVTELLVMDPSVAVSQAWRLLTSGFLHSTAFLLPVHLLFNMYALFAFGPALESFLGRARFLVLFLLATIGGSVAEVLNYQLVIVTGGDIVEQSHGLIRASQSLGASGAVFGLLGALIVGRRAIGLRLMPLLVVAGLNLVLGFTVPNIAWQAHLGGFGVGAAVMAIYLATRRREARSRQILGVVGVAVALALIVVACAASAGYPYYR